MSTPIPTRIEREARAWRLKENNQYRSDPDFVFKIDGTEIENIYTAGATTWAERAEKLREALQHIHKWSSSEENRIFIEKVLEEYKKQTQ